MKSIQDKLIEAQSREKSYVDHKVIMKYISPFEAFEYVGLVEYILALPPNLSGVFHVSMLKRYQGDRDYIVKWDSLC